MGYDVADKPKLQGTFRNAAGTLADPDTVTLRIKYPDASTTTHVYGVDANVIRDSVGVYYYLLPLTLEGAHYYRWEGSGALYAGGEKKIVVNQSVFYPLPP